MRWKSRLFTTCVAAAAITISARATDFSIGGDFNSYETLDTYDASNPNGDNTGDAISAGVSGAMRVGSRTVSSSTGFGTAASPIFAFELPALPAGEAVSSATLSIMTKTQTSNLPASGVNADLYGLPYDAAALDQDPTRYYAGGNDTTSGVELLQDNFLVPADAAAADARHVSVDISAWLQAQYDAGAVAGDFAILRFSYDQVPDLHAHNRYLIWQRRASSTTENDSSVWPYLNITTEAVPEPASLGLFAFGGCTLLARRRVRRDARPV
jgi:hypothetical protein